MINLDYASHTPVDRRVLDYFLQIEEEFFCNVMSAHSGGRLARAKMDEVTAGIAELIGAKPEEIIFTSGASEANNLAIKGLYKAYSHVGKHVLSTCLEHPSVSGTLAALPGAEIELLKILPNGLIDLEQLKSAIRPDTVLLCISAVDSELGVIQPLKEISAIMKAHPNCHLHVDAAQAVGKIPVELHGASTFCFTAHKFYGLCGVGVLVKREGVILEPIIHGGKSTTIYRSGTPALSLAASCYYALKIAMEAQAERVKHVQSIKEYVLDAIKGKPFIAVNTPAENASPYILNLSVKGMRGMDFQAALDSRGILVSTKSACSTDRAPSRPVMAITGNKNRALNSWRVSFSHLTTFEDVEAFVQVCKELTQ